MLRIGVWAINPSSTLDRKSALFDVLHLVEPAGTTRFAVKAKRMRRRSLITEKSGTHNNTESACRFRNGRHSHQYQYWQQPPVNLADQGFLCSTSLVLGHMVRVLIRMRGAPERRHLVARTDGGPHIESHGNANRSKEGDEGCQGACLWQRWSIGTKLG